MKTFNSLLLENVPQVNDPEAMRDYPHEVGRQIENFHQWMDDNPSKIPLAIHQKIKSGDLPKLNWRSVLAGDKLKGWYHNLAKYLDLYHHHLPDAAAEYNMHPMNNDEIEADQAYDHIKKEEVAANCMGTGANIASVDPLLKLTKNKLKTRILKRWGNNK